MIEESDYHVKCNGDASRDVERFRSKEQCAGLVVEQLARTSGQHVRLLALFAALVFLGLTDQRVSTIASFTKPNGVSSVGIGYQRSGVRVPVNLFGNRATADRLLHTVFFSNGKLIILVFCATELSRTVQQEVAVNNRRTSATTNGVPNHCHSEGSTSNMHSADVHTEYSQPMVNAVRHNQYSAYCPFPESLSTYGYHQYGPMQPALPGYYSGSNAGFQNSAPPSASFSSPHPAPCITSNNNSMSYVNQNVEVASQDPVKTLDASDNSKLQKRWIELLNLYCRVHS